jgi:hypothetical protein
MELKVKIQNRIIARFGIVLAGKMLYGQILDRAAELGSVRKGTAYVINFYKFVYGV